MEEVRELFVCVFVCAGLGVCVLETVCVSVLVFVCMQAFKRQAIAYIVFVYVFS